MTVTIGRRELLVALGGAAAAWPLTARAQQQALPVVGFLSPGSQGALGHLVAAFRRGLPATSSIETSALNISGQRGRTIGCRRWPMSWCALGSR